MNITDIRIRKVVREGKMKAAVSITFDNEFAVHDIKIIDGDEGLFVAMPSRTSYDRYSGKDKFIDIAHPINSEVREKIQNAILAKYHEEVQNG